MPPDTRLPDQHLHRGTPRRLEAALAAWLAGLKAADPLHPAVVVVGSNLVRARLSVELAASMGAVAGVRIVSIHVLAPEVAALSLGAADAAAPVQLAPLVRERLVATLAQRRPPGEWYFGPVAGMPGLPRVLARSIDDLREALVPPAALDALRSSPARDLRRLYAEFETALRDGGLSDDAGLYERAAERAVGWRPGVPVALFGLYDLPPMQERFVAALAAGRPFAAFVPSGQAVSQLAQPLLHALHTPGATEADVDDQQDGATRALPVLQIVSAHDEAAQRRAVAAELLRAADEGLAFHEMAVVVPDAAGRDRLAGELAARHVPVAARRRASTVAARTAGLLLDCLLPTAGPPLPRVGVLDLAATAPRPGADPAAVALWDVLARRARVVHDADWSRRLGREEYRLKRRLESCAAGESGDPGYHHSAGDGGDPAARAEHLASELAAVRSLREFAGELHKARALLLSAGSWRQAAHHFVEALQALCGVAADDPVCVRTQSVADLDLVDTGAPGEAFGPVARELLADLELPSDRRVGRDGVAVLSPHQARGLSFALVVVTDVAEGSFPPRPAADPALPDADRARLNDAHGARLALSSAVDVENDALFELLLQAAERRIVLLFPRLDAATARPRLPSRLLLALAAQRAGRLVLSDELERDGALDGLVRRLAREPEPLDVRDLDLSVLVPSGGARLRQADWREAYAQRVMGAAGAERAGAAALGRRARALGPRDGRLSPANAALAADAFFERAVSPSAVEAYLKCPFAFYLRHILGIDVPDEPDELLEIEPIELGNLAHRILEDAYSQAGPERDTVLQALDRVAAEGFARAERHGVTGFPLAWRVLRGQLL
ncbi:MAG TPA: PD-(D/E)XK nuclease family protein, partial [Thermoleophilia bacterium]|nr:PD-(D/E)XK nuclease family protein [Thermoleophilia bacterium]